LKPFESKHIAEVQPCALFLDRDGVINVNHGYVHTVEKFEFIDGIFNLVRTAHANNLKVVVITNQAGIGRGFYSEYQFHELTSWMCKEFMNAGAPIDKVYFSPFHPTEGLGKYKKDDFSRKPNPGMILQAQQELGLDLENSILIGDKGSDIQAGIAAGLGLNILFSRERPPELTSKVYTKVTTLSEVIPLISTYDMSL
jgi:D-glycero-D-manno-heptose 1,7-bisphosphate phosphatase